MGCRDAGIIILIVAAFSSCFSLSSSALLEHRIMGHFDLARLYDRRREEGRALDHWRAGHRLLSRGPPFSRDRFRGFVDASIAAFDAARLGAGPRAATADQIPVFIVGMPRSGITLTAQVLAAHAAVYAAGELASMGRTINRLAGPPLHTATVSRLAGLDAAALDDAAARYREELRALSPEARCITTPAASAAGSGTPPGWPR